MNFDGQHSMQKTTKSGQSSQQKLILRIQIIGDKEVGKTQFISQYSGSGFTERYQATVGADFSKKIITVNEQTLELQIWEVAGQQEFDMLGNAFFRGGECCVLMYDITNPKSFDSLEQKRNQYFHQAQSKDPGDFPLVLIGNKVDKAAVRQVEVDKVQQWCQQYGNIPYFETSAKDGTNIEYAFEEIAKAAARERQKELLHLDPILTKQFHRSPQKQNRCY